MVSAPPSKPIVYGGRWTVQGKLFGEHVFNVIDRTGLQAVLKKPRNGKWPTPQRFWEEAKGSKQLTEEGVTGVLPVIDVAPGDKPGWMVTERATPLPVHLARKMHNFRLAVAVTAEVAHTVASLHARTEPLAHRDLKPRNLFWLKGRAVVGDFGISTWAPPVALTQLGDKVGPLYYIAPEAEKYDLRPAQACRADVFSLAKVMWHFCARASHPPQGPLGVQDAEASLHAYGGRSSRSLRYLIDRATAFRPQDRPSMRDLAYELDAWLEQYPAGHADIEPLKPSKIIGGPAYPDFDAMAWDSGRRPQLRNRLREAARNIMRATDDEAEFMGSEQAIELLQDTSDIAEYQSDEYPWEPDDYEQVGLELGPVRVVIASVLIGAEVWHLAELQQDGTLMDGLVYRTWGRFACPTDDDARDSLEKWAIAVVRDLPRKPPFSN